MNSERDKLKREYQNLFLSISAVLFKADPIGINFEDNTDEYAPEVGTILPRLHSALSEVDVQAIIYEEFVRWFDKETVGAKESYAAVAVEIWCLWCETNKNRMSSSDLTSHL